MDPRFFSILGLIPTHERARTGLNDARSHRDDEPWRLGAVPDSLVSAFQPSPTGIATTDVRRVRESPCDAIALPS